MSFTVVTALSTQIVESSSSADVKQTVDGAPANITIKRRSSVEDEIAASDSLTVDLSGYATMKGLALESDNPVSVQLLGAGNLTNVTHIHMRGTYTSMVVSNAGTETAVVEILVYGDPS